MSAFAKVAKDVQTNLTKTQFAKVALEVQGNIMQQEEHDADWHRVNSYVADVLKDAHVLFAKLSRLQSDFAGSELGTLEEISNQVLEVGQSLSEFSRSFYDGELNMIPSDVLYGGSPQVDPPQGQGQAPQGQGQGQGQGSPPPVFGEFQGQQQDTQAPVQQF